MSPSTLHSPTLDLSQMPSGSDPARPGAGLIGKTAHDILSEGFTGHVIASGSSALYLRGDRDEIMGVGRLNQPAHTRYLLASLEPLSIPTGTKAWSDGKKLSFEDGKKIELSDATIWQGHGPDSLNVIPVDKVDVGAALQSAMSLHSGQNLVASLKRIYGHDHEYAETQTSYEETFLDAATESIRTVAGLCKHGSFGMDVEAVRQLVGLGPGLTPSGDDFLGGLLFAVWHLNAVYPSIISSNTESVDGLLGFASSQTNQISYAILTDFAVGQGPSPLHDLLDALLTGQPISTVSDCIRQVGAIGHSSGWDILAGFMVGMTMIDKSSDA